MAKVKRVVILNGPCKVDLRDALFENSPTNPINVTFQLQDKGPISLHYRVTFLIYSVAREDGSGNSWLISGYIQNPGSLLKGDLVLVTPTLVSGYYSSRTRKGYLDLVS